MPKMIFQTPVVDARPAIRYASAGAVPSTGVPVSNANPGSYDFETHILVIGAQPVISASGFATRLAQTVNDSDLRMSAAPVTVSATTITAAPTNDFATEVGNGLRSGGLGLAESVGGGIRVPKYWITITGTFNAIQRWYVEGLNRAIQRALIQNLTWAQVDPAFSNKLPAVNDGTGPNSLFATFAMPNACEGGANWTKVFARACTRYAVSGYQLPGNAPNATPVTTPSQVPPTPSRPVTKSNTGWWVVGGVAAVGVAYLATRKKSR